MTATLLIALTFGSFPQARTIEGTYRNFALGYSIIVPKGLKGRTFDQSGPERGLRIQLPSGGDIVVYGEPNSLEYKDPSDAVRDSLKLHDCVAGAVARATVGQLPGAEGRMSCGDGTAVFVFLCAFRPGGGPIYWLVLSTRMTALKDDEQILRRFARTLRMVRWG